MPRLAACSALEELDYSLETSAAGNQSRKAAAFPLSLLVNIGMLLCPLHFMHATFFTYSLLSFEVDTIPYIII